MTKLFTTWLVAAVLCLGAIDAAAIEIDGTQPLAFDQPQVNAVLQPEAGGQPYGFSFGGFSTFNITGFLDTGASGIVISQSTADGFEVPTAPGVTYSDVAVGGSTDFSVSTPLNVRIAASNNLGIDNPATFQTVYNQVTTSVRTQVGPALTNVPDENTLSEALDVFGMPVMMGKTVVMDPKPLNNTSPDPNLFSFMNTYIYNQGTPFNPATADTNPGIPATSHHVQLSYGDFGRFTSTSPDGSSPPTLGHNPFIGPNPVDQLNPLGTAQPASGGTPPPPISLDFNGNHAQGSFLLDTGAAVSFISTSIASSLHVRYSPTADPLTPQLETFNPAHPELPGTPIADQFSLQLLGLGGQVNVAGFYLDDLILHTLEGSALDLDPNNIKFLHAPVFVQDIAVQDPLTSQTLTLDGVFGMNFLVASGLLVINGFDFDILKASAGPFGWVTFDEPNGILGLDLIPAPEPGSIGLAATAGLLLAAYAWRNRRTRQSARR